MKRLLLGTLLWLPVLCSCVDAREVSGVYREEFETGLVPEDRAYALRITLHEFDGVVGGWVEYYGQDALNTPLDPFVLPTYCSYFGQFQRTAVGVVVRVSSPQEAVDLQLRFSPREGKVMTASVESSGGIYVEDAVTAGRSLRVRDELRAVADGCPSMATLIDRPLTGIRPR